MNEFALLQPELMQCSSLSILTQAGPGHALDKLAIKKGRASLTCWKFGFHKRWGGGAFNLTVKHRTAIF